MKVLTLAATAVLLMGAPAFAQDKIDAQTFVEKATMTDMTEIKAGEMAQEDGNSAEVKEFGKHMVMDHTKLGNELKQVIKEHKTA